MMNIRSNSDQQKQSNANSNKSSRVNRDASSEKDFQINHDYRLIVKKGHQPQEPRIKIQKGTRKLIINKSSQESMLDNPSDPKPKPIKSWESVQNSFNQFQELKDSTNPYSPSLMRDPQFNSCIRFSMPFCLIFACFIFLSAQMSQGAKVEFNGQVLGQNIRTDSLLTFSLVETIENMWKAGVQVLAILIFLLSGVIPQIKLIMMGQVWIVDSKSMDHISRGQTLRWLDNIGKWALIDFALLVIFKIAFNYHTDIHGGMPANTLQIVIQVFSGWGLWGFTIAVVMSLAMTHVMTEYHRDQVATIEDDGGAVSVANFRQISSTHQIEGRVQHLTHRMTTCGWLTILFLLLVSLVLLILGIIEPSYYIQFSGLAGNLMDKNYTRISLIETALQLISQEQNITSYFEFTMQLVFMILYPLAQLLSLITVMFLRQSKKCMRKSTSSLEVLNGWGSVEVQLLSLLASLQQMDEFVEFMIGDNCDGINTVLSNFPNLVTQPKCFHVQSGLMRGWYLLLASLILYWTTGWYMTKLLEDLQTSKDIDHYHVRRLNTYEYTEGLRMTYKEKFYRDYMSWMYQTEIIEVY